MSRLLLLEDDLTFAGIVSGFLKRYDFTIDHAANLANAHKMQSEKRYDLFLLDYRLPDGNGLEFLENVRSAGIAAPAIIMTSLNDIRTAVKAIRVGAFDYITKPVNQDELLMVIQEALGKNTTATTKNVLSQKDTFIEGVSEVSKQMLRHIELVAPTDMTVLLMGESGTGKEFAARRIHQQSKRKNEPFVAIDCGTQTNELASSELFGHVKGAFTGANSDKTGQFELAAGGTLFLDEISNLSYEVQLKLLRALQERIIQPLGSNRRIPVDGRILAATNDDLLIKSREGAFREDLYHRINEFSIRVPALRDRIEDFPFFLEHFIQTANQNLGRQVENISDDAREILESYDWPGNIRELGNIIKRSVLLTQGKTIEADSLPEDLLLGIYTRDSKPPTDLKDAKEESEKRMIVEMLQKTRFNKAEAARRLNIDRKTLYNKMNQYNIR